MMRWHRRATGAKPSMLFPAAPRRTRIRPPLLAALLVLAPALAHAATITVDSTADDLALGANGNCTLREAVIAANTDAAVDGCAAGSSADVITVPAGTYTLTIPRPAAS